MRLVARLAFLVAGEPGKAGLEGSGAAEPRRWCRNSCATSRRWRRGVVWSVLTIATSSDCPPSRALRMTYVQGSAF